MNDDFLGKSSVETDSTNVEKNLTKTSASRRKRHYVGINGETVEAFSALAKSEEAKPIKYSRVIGPFNTARGQQHFVKYHMLSAYNFDAKKPPMRLIEKNAMREALHLQGNQ